MTTQPLLSVDHLTIWFTRYGRGARRVELPVIEDLSVRVHEGELVAIVGASGSGKTLIAEAIVGLAARNANVRGSISFAGEPQDAAGLARLRGQQIALVPQAVTALDPLLKVGAQLVGVARDRTQARARMLELFDRYGLAAAVADRYPHELSGGMARRVVLVAALMGDPRLIVADEPTPGLHLELAVQALADLRDYADRGNGVLLITHDLELALRVADRIAVCEAGRILEVVRASDFADESRLQHPYTRALWRALPSNEFTAWDARPARTGGPR